MSWLTDETGPRLVDHVYRWDLAPIPNITTTFASFLDSGGEEHDGSPKVKPKHLDYHLVAGCGIGNIPHPIMVCKPN